MARKRRSKRFRKDFFDKYDYSTLESTSPVCSHFGLCGGCRFQNITYDSQLQLKKDYLKNIFGEDVNIVSSKNPFGYRNRMDFVYDKGVLGLRKRGDFRTVIDIDDCFLIPDQFKEIFFFVKNSLKEKNIPSYNIDSQEGFLRYVVFRFAPSTGEVMLILTSKSPKDDSEKKLFENFLILLSEKVDSVYWFVNDELTDISIPYNNYFKVFGKKTITEKFGDVNLSFGPQSFFQANSLMSEIVFNKIKSFVKGEVFDLCCGVGAIGLFVADAVKSVCGLDSVSSAIDFAKLNAKNNSVSNAIFFSDDMKNLLDYSPLNLDTLIVDPPRAGLGNKVLKRILELKPQRIIYMSCNPKTQKIDLDILLKDNLYKQVFLEAYDMFSQTSHLESLLVLDLV